MDTIKKSLAGLVLLAAFALGGAAIAGAADSDSSSNAAATETSKRNDQAPRQRADEELLTGETAEKVRAAALAKEAGTVDRVETDGDGNAKYEAHITKADGSRVTVYVNEQFEVVGVDSR